MTKLENVINKLQEGREWKVKKTTGSKYLPDGIVLSACKGWSLLTVVLNDEHSVEIGRKTIYRHPSYYICHQQNIFQGEITYEHSLETEQDIEDFLSYVNYHYDNITGF